MSDVNGLELPTAGGTGGTMIGPRLSAMMFLQFFLWGAWYVTVGNYMKTHGMGGGIFWAYTVGPIAAIVSPFFLGMIADRFFATERVLGVMHILGGLALLAAPTVATAAAGDAAEGPSHWPFTAVLLLHMLCYMPTLGLSNTLAFHNMTNQEKQFPIVRVFGTIGWIVAGFAVGYIAAALHPYVDYLASGFTMEQFDAVRIALEAKQEVAADALARFNETMAATTNARAGEPAFFYAAGASGILLGIFSFTLPHTPPPAAGKAFNVRDALGLDSLALLKDRSFIVFIVSSFLICIPLAAYYAYAPVFANAMGYDKNTPVIMSTGQMSEIVFMLVMPLFFARLGVKWMLAVGMLAWVVRYGLFAAAADDQIKWMVLGGILLHGICYDFFFVTGFIYVDKKAPPQVRGQAQGFLVLVTQGLGMLIGAQVIGALVNANTTKVEGQPDVLDWQFIWLVPCIMAAVILVAFVALFKDRKVDAPTPTAPETFPV